MEAAGVTSFGFPSKKTATHSTTVPLYCGWDGTVRVYTMLPLSLTKLDLMLGNSPTGDPFTLQVMKASDDVCRHLQGAGAVPNSTGTLIGTSAKSATELQYLIQLFQNTLHKHTCHSRWVHAYDQHDQGS